MAFSAHARAFRAMRPACIRCQPHPKCMFGHRRCVSLARSHADGCRRPCDHKGNAPRDIAVRIVLVPITAIAALVLLALVISNRVGARTSIYVTPPHATVSPSPSPTLNLFKAARRKAWPTARLVLSRMKIRGALELRSGFKSSAPPRRPETDRAKAPARPGTAVWDRAP